MTLRLLGVNASGFDPAGSAATAQAAAEAYAAGLFATQAGQYAAAVMADSPAIWWQLADAVGTTSIVDSSGNGHTGTLTPGNGSLGWPGPLITKPSATALYCDGVSTKVTCGYNPTGLSAGTWEVWSNSNGIVNGGGTRLLSTGHADVGTGGVEFIVNSTELQFIAANGSSDAGPISPFPLPGPGWTHFVATFAGNELTIYQDTLPSAQTPLSGTIAADPAGGFTVGSLIYSGGFVNFWKGLVAQAAFYPTALSEARIQAHFEAAQYV